MKNQFRGYLTTDSGMWGLWNTFPYSNIKSYEDWESYFLTDELISTQIREKNFVPINIEADGNFEFQVKKGSTIEAAVLTAREKKYVLVESGNYLINSKGKIAISGIEHIGSLDTLRKDEDYGEITTDSDSYHVKIFLIEWDAEPGMLDSNQNKVQYALPDFIILLNPVSPDSERYSESITTFSQ